MKNQMRLVTLLLFAISLFLPLAIPAQPVSAGSGYKLPYAAGSTFNVSQGNNTGGSGGDHTGLSKYAWDFGMGSNTVVVAARGGTVTRYYENSQCNSWPSQTCINDVNYVVVDHGDGTQALYL